jgi:Fe-S oxidoreductase
MATYKAEFLSHYYKGRVRPRAAYSMGLIFLWSRLAALAPGLVNGALEAPAIGPAIKWLAGFTQARPAPAFARETFQAWWAQHAPARAQDPTLPAVVLWPDTFHNHFLPGTLKAAVTVLADAGYRVVVPSSALCCGRPLYDYGMLDLARDKLAQVLEALRPAIRAGAPIVGLEPSCLSVFRDEMLNLMPEDPDARRLAAQTKTLSELLLETPGWQPPPLKRKAVLHTHCHHKAVLNADTVRTLLERMGLEIETPPVGCCGHAGSFGYEAEHHATSMQIGELVLLPKVRKTSRETLVIADGFSCRQQIKDGVGRWAMHPAEVLALALESRGEVPAEIPERRYLEPAAAPSKTALLAAGVGIAAATLALRAVTAKRR